MNMSASESSTPSSSCNNNNGLLALANLAEIIIDCKEGNEQRYNTSSSNEETTSRITIMDETASTTSMPLSTTTPASLPTSRRPAKKRAVPSTFNNNDDDAAAAAANKRPKFIPPPHQQQQYNDDNTITISCAIPRKRSFPMILMDILLASSSSPSITFLSDGMTFIIINPVSLSRDVLSVYFKDYGNLITIGDFLQLLDVWGFETSHDPNYPHVNVYKHPMFRRNDWEACMQMKPAPKFGGCVGQSSNDHQDNYSSSTTRSSLSAKARSSRRVSCDVDEKQRVILYQQLLRDRKTLQDKVARLEKHHASVGRKRVPSSHRRVTVDSNVSAARVTFQAASLHQQKVGQRHQQTSTTSTKMPINHRRATVDSMPSARMLYPQGAPSPPTLSFAEMAAATQKVVTAAIDAVHGPKSLRRITVEHEGLDSMTHLFLNRSLKRISTTKPQAVQAVFASMVAKEAQTKPVSEALGPAAA